MKNQKRADRAGASVMLAGLLGISGGAFGAIGAAGARRRWAAACAAGLATLVTAGVACAQESVAAVPPARSAEASPDRGYARVREIEGDGGVELQISARTMTPGEPGRPLVKLVGVTHIGDKAYYQALQEYLNGHDMVLFEGVKPAGLDAPGDATRGPEPEKTEQEKAQQTERRLRVLAILAERYRRDNQELPSSVDAMIEGLGGPTKRLVRSAANDGWGRPIVYTLKPSAPGADGALTPATYEIESLGSDGMPGGDGPAKDLRFSTQKPLTKDERTGGGGLQENLARSLGLEFQLVAMDYDRKNWRNSDMSIDQVQKDLAELGASGDMLFKMLDGSSMSAKVVNLMLMVVKSSPTMAASAKVMLIETLANADALLERSAQAGGGNTGALMKVIVGHRNDAVISDLKGVLAETSEPRPTEIALFYGAGHLPDLKTKLEAMGYALDPSQDQWFTAIRVTSAQSGLPASQIKMLRETIRKSLGSALGGPAPAASKE